MRDGSLVVLHVNVEVKVRIGPLDPDDGARQCDRLVGVVLGGERVMGGED
jgi:hypothetical protein